MLTGISLVVTGGSVAKIMGEKKKDNQPKE